MNINVISKKDDNISFDFKKWYEDKVMIEINYLNENKLNLSGLNYILEEDQDMEDFNGDLINDQATYHVCEINNCLRNLYELYQQGIERGDNLHKSPNLTLPMNFIQNWLNGNYNKLFLNLEVFSEEKLIKSNEI
tara:strand:+ start:1358 stop:1762 length:405 start_codon:yes stop_codon:yes gene_type:complete